MNNHGAKSDDFVAMQDPNVFTVRRPLQERGKIDSGLSRRKRGHASILRRYGEQFKCRNQRFVQFPEAFSSVLITTRRHARLSGVSVDASANACFVEFT